MTLTEMTQAANLYTDENFNPIQCLAFVNEAIGAVNAELDAELPFIDSVSTNYIALTETWIRQLLIPYIAYSIKMNDGSLQEASVYLRMFENGLSRLFNHKDTAIEATYQSSSFGNPVVQIDYASNLSSLGLYGDNYIPEYNEYVIYYVNNLVYYNDVTYICIKNTKGNLPTNTTYWRVYD